MAGSGGAEPFQVANTRSQSPSRKRLAPAPVSLLPDGQREAISSLQVQGWTVPQVFSGCWLSLRFAEPFSSDCFSDLYRP